MRTEIILSGSGGQGLISAGIILAKAAINSGLNMVQTQSYESQSRGGGSKSEIIIDTDEIHFPKIKKPHLLLCLTKESYMLYNKDIKDQGIVIVDSHIKTESRENLCILKMPIIETARKKINKEIVANIVSLGIVRQITEIASRACIEHEVFSMFPKISKEIYIEALNQGELLIEKYISKETIKDDFFQTYYENYIYKQF